MKVYTEAEFEEEQLENSLFNRLDDNLGGFKRIVRKIDDWRNFSRNETDFASGLELSIDNTAYFQDYSLANRHDEFQMLVSKFYLLGDHGVICPGIPNVEAEYIEKAGQNYLFYLPDIEEVEQYKARCFLKRIVINLDLSFLKTFVTELDDVPKQLRPLIERDNAPYFHRPVGKVTPTMRQIIMQIWHHPYQGAIARMYLEGKVLELLALQLSQLSESKSSAAKFTLHSKSIDRIYQAKDILASRLENPPSISELTQQVGLCDRTLRRGFRELFGTTVIGYLTLLRMKQAERLLREGKLSIGEVANLVGYSHLGHFSAAFKRQFGITPSQCLAGKKSF